MLKIVVEDSKRVLRSEEHVLYRLRVCAANSWLEETKRPPERLAGSWSRAASSHSIKSVGNRSWCIARPLLRRRELLFPRGVGGRSSSPSSSPPPKFCRTGVVPEAAAVPFLPWRGNGDVMGVCALEPEPESAAVDGSGLSSSSSLEPSPSQPGLDDRERWRLWALPASASTEETLTESSLLC